MRSAQIEVSSLECKAWCACFDLLCEELMAMHLLTAIQRADSCEWIFLLFTAQNAKEVPTVF